MLTLVPKEIELYAVDHTSKLPANIEELTSITYDTMDVPQMLSGPIEGTMLQFLIRAIGATRVIDVGTFTGFSAQMMAAALPDNGTVVTCENDFKHAEMAREYFNKSPHKHKIDLRMGQALNTLNSLTGTYDLIFIDAEKTEYIGYYENSLELLSEKGFIVVDNVLWGGRVLNPRSASDRAIAAFNNYVQQDSRVRQVLLPIRDGVMLIQKA